MMEDQKVKPSRVIAVIAATCISLACGTNYAYSSWAPQFANKLHLSATQSNLIGVAGNMGMYASGIPTGLLVDRRGPRPAVIIGSICLACGYFPLRKAYDDGPGSMNVPTLSFLSFLTGLGSCAAFNAAIKAAAVNWPHHRGTATGLPLSAFGLSAFFFTTVSGLTFPDDTSHLLLLLAVGTTCLTFIGMFFLHVPRHHSEYQALPTQEERPGFSRSDSNPLHRTKSGGSKSSKMQEEPEVDETSSLVSSEGPGDIDDTETENSKHLADHQLHNPDITMHQLLFKLEFWQLFFLLGLLCGVGLMTINNIGNDAQALWSHYDDSVSHSFILKRQLIQVAIISLGSFIGRLLTGVGSDFLVKKLHASRFWCLVTASGIFTIAQIVASRTENPNHLAYVSALTGLAYGALFGVYPAITADTFGIGGLSFNWGALTLSPVVTGNIFNLCYGAIYDKHSFMKDGERTCVDGLECYRGAYYISLSASLIGVLVSLWSIHHEHVTKRKLASQIGSHEA